MYSRTSLDFYKAHFEFSSSGMAVVDHLGRWVNVNPSFCQMLGYSIQDISSIDWYDLLAQGSQYGFKNWMNDILSGATGSYDGSVKLVRKDKSLVIAKLSAKGIFTESGVLDFVLIQVEDCFQERQANELLKYYQIRANLLMSTIDTAHDPVIVMDINHVFLFANAAGRELIESGRLAIVREGEFWLRHLKHRGLLSEAVQKLTEGNSIVEKVLYDGDFSPRWWMTVLPLGKQVALEQHAIMAVFHEPKATTHHINEFLRQGYNLKAAELRLATALVKGTTPEEYALSTGLQISTVRTQIRSIFAKTGAKRQSDLVRMLSDVPRVRK